MAILLASLLDANWMNLADEVQAVDAAGIDGFSIDVCDGQFVPRITFGPHIASKIRNITDLPIEVHLMVSKPEKFVEQYCDAGADQLIFHVETTNDPFALIDYVKSRGLQVGLALCRDTPLTMITDRMLESINALNFMAIVVGYGGQKASEHTLEKVQIIRERAKSINPLLALEIDGGMKAYNCADYVKAGADVIIMGTGIYKTDNYNDAVRLAKQHMLENDVESQKRLKAFLSGPSINLVNDIERRKRLDQIRINFNIPETSWDPLNSRR